MNYCKNCSRIVEADTTICPFCNSEMNVKEESQEIVENKISEINDFIKEANESENVTPFSAPPVINNIPQTQFTSTPQTFAGTPPPFSIMEETDNDLTVWLKAIIAFFSVLISPAGIIIGIILMTGTGQKKKAFGTSVLLFSIMAIVIPIICCCILGMTGLLTEFANGFNQGFYNGMY